jgi:crossover junction endodeoxyribonuclease RuvC
VAGQASHAAGGPVRCEPVTGRPAMIRVAGLDLSMSSTGIARVRVDAPGALGHLKLYRVETERADTPKGEQPTLAERAARLTGVLSRTVDIICPADRVEQWPDLVVAEAPSYGSVGYMQHDIAGNWWGPIRELLAMGVPVAEVTPTKLKIYAVGRGNTRDSAKAKAVTKTEVVAAVKARYPEAARQIRDLGGGSDTSDALILAAIGCRYLGHPIDGVMPRTHLRALDEIRWPERKPL